MVEHDGCIGCKYECESENSKNCKGCRQTFLDKYTPKTKGHDKCIGCDYEYKGRNNENCKLCKHNAIDKYTPVKVKYYIRARFGDWKEVTKEKADSFINDYLESVVIPNEERKQEIISKHYKEVIE